ncbi:MAG: hypothetical protein LIO55_08630 [Oscillospiraceae bacterium]|nr:hypothetical protein [Oscillospiraceae bacterium]
MGKDFGGLIIFNFMRLRPVYVRYGGKPGAKTEPCPGENAGRLGFFSVYGVFGRSGALKPTMELLMAERFPDAALQFAEREKICEKNVKIEFFTTEIW